MTAREHSPAAEQECYKATRATLLGIMAVELVPPSHHTGTLQQGWNQMFSVAQLYTKLW